MSQMLHNSMAVLAAQAILDMRGDAKAEITKLKPAPKVAAGVGTLRRRRPKVGRNEPCPCGSGTKYKRCHGRDG